MKITIDVSTMQNRFAACGRDYYSWEGYEALLATQGFFLLPIKL